MIGVYADEASRELWGRNWEKLDIFHQFFLEEKRSQRKDDDDGHILTGGG